VVELNDCRQDANWPQCLGIQKMLRQQIAMRLLRPYTLRELPGWGRLYKAFVGDYDADLRWKGFGPRWVRGKLHGYEMLLDLGYWSNRATYFLGRFYDLPTQLALKAILKPGETFIDVGANEGMISLLASRLVDGGNVIAFEPNEKPRKIFQQAIERNRISNIQLIPYGLGQEDAFLDFNVPHINTGEGSFGKPNYEASEIDTIKCQIKRGDDLLKSETPALIKIDVEGFEFEVLQGLQQTILRAKPAMIVEMITGALANSGASVNDVRSFLEERGYESFRLGLDGRHSLKLTKCRVPDEVYGDFLWQHPAGRSISNA
jgi:FkbM family methyltransferase